jgi:hypothetical protein
MPTSALATLATVLSSFRLHFTAPSFLHFVLLAAGWILAVQPSPGGRITSALVAADLARRRHWEAFHRFFSRALWSPDRLGHTLFRLLEPLLALDLLEVAIDDTVCEKRGARVFGTSMHVDAVTSTTKRKNLVRGHAWVELGLVLRVPWSKRAWFVPLLLRLYTGKKEAGAGYRTKPQLARELLDRFLAWVPPGRSIRLLLDSGYMVRTLLRDLPFDRVTVVGSLKTNAALYRPLHQARIPRKTRGRRRKKGDRLPTPARMNRDRRRSWAKLDLTLGGEVRQRQVLSFKAQWYGVLGERLCRLVLLREDEVKLRVILCTNPSWSARQVIEQGARRWPIEVWHRDVKQFFGFADSPAWSQTAVERTAPWVALLSGILVVWFHRLYRQGMKVPMPERPWYGWKEDVSFADVVRAAQETLRGVDVLLWAEGLCGEAPASEKAERTKSVERPEVAEKAKAA